MVIAFQHPISMIVSGPSGSGKTTFTLDLINNLNRLVEPLIENILWCYSEDNALRTQNQINEQQRQKIKYHKGLPESFENPDDTPMLIILDDLMMEANNSMLCELYTRGSHHRNQSVVLISQNMFHRGAHCRDVSLNTKYMVVFKNPRDQTQIRYLAKQICPDNTKELLGVFKEVTDTPHNYLLFDLTQETNDWFRFRTNIFDENYTVVYCSEKNPNFGNEALAEMQAFTFCFEKCKK